MAMRTSSTRTFSGISRACDALILSQVLRDRIPARAAQDRQSKLELLVFLPRTSGAEDVVDQPFTVGRADRAGLVGPQPKFQATFLGVVDVAMQDEGIDAVGLVDDL